jgi:hypothetical protein
VDELTIILIKAQGLQDLIDDCKDIPQHHKEAINSLILRAECMVSDIMDAKDGEG